MSVVAAWMPFAIGVGANLGDRPSQVAVAADMLAAGGDCRSIRIAPPITTDPVVPADRVDEHPAYLNTAIIGETVRSPVVLMARLLSIETACGRRRRGAVDPRTLDLDLLVLGDRRIERPGLDLPHPRLAGRRFVLDPLLGLLRELESQGEAGELVAGVWDALGRAGVPKPHDS